MNKHYSVTEQANVQILSITSLLDEWENRYLLRTIQHRIDDGAALFVIDLMDLELINSVGLNFLLAVLSRLKNIDGHLLLANVQEQVHNLLEITKLHNVFDIKSSVEEAISYLEEDAVFA